MKKFSGNKSGSEIQQQCAALGLILDDSNYESGGDYWYIQVRKGEDHGGRVCYNTVNGSFFGETPEGVKFNSMHTTHEGEAWFQSLLSFFYKEKDAVEPTLDFFGVVQSNAVGGVHV